MHAQPDRMERKHENKRHRSDKQFGFRKKHSTVQLNMITYMRDNNMTYKADSIS